MPTIERRYEAAVTALDEIVRLSSHLSILVAMHAPEGSKMLNQFRSDYINSAFRTGGADATVKGTLDELDSAIEQISRFDKAKLPEAEVNFRRGRNLGTRAGTSGRSELLKLKVRTYPTHNSK